MAAQSDSLARVLIIPLFKARRGERGAAARGPPARVMESRKISLALYRNGLNDRPNNH